MLDILDQVPQRRILAGDLVEIKPYLVIAIIRLSKISDLSPQPLDLITLLSKYAKSAK